jgi:hypothetical protein
MQNVGLSSADLETIFAQLLVRPEITDVRFLLTELRWDNNHVTPSFLRVLEKCPQLHILSLNGSITGADKSIQHLSDFLSVNTTIQDLSLRGTVQRRLPAWQLITALEHFKVYNRTITRLDLSHNSFDQRAFDNLADLLLKNRVLACVRFQNFGFPDPLVLDGFLKQLLPRGAPIEIPLPRVDLEEMLRSGMLNLQVLAGLLTLLARLAAGDRTIPLPPQSLSRAAEPPEPGYRVSGEPPPPAPAAEGAPTAKAAAAEGPPDAPRAAGSAPAPGVPVPGEWELVFDSVPPPDNDALLRSFWEEFSPDKLLAKVKSSG